MRLMGLEAIYRRPNTSKPAPGHRIFPYLLKGVEVNRVDQVWAADITYIPMANGFLYLVAIMDWHSRHVLAWKLSNTMTPASAWRRWRKPWVRDDRRYSTPTRESVHQ